MLLSTGMAHSMLKKLLTNFFFLRPHRESVQFGRHIFTVGVYSHGMLLCEGHGETKRRAEMDGAARALRLLKWVFISGCLQFFCWWELQKRIKVERKNRGVACNSSKTLQKTKKNYLFGALVKNREQQSIIWKFLRFFTFHYSVLKGVADDRVVFKLFACFTLRTLQELQSPEFQKSKSSTHRLQRAIHKLFKDLKQMVILTCIK